MRLDLWELTGGVTNPEAYHKLAEPTVRHRIASLIVQARDKDAGAAGHLERALDAR